MADLTDQQILALIEEAKQNAHALTNSFPMLSVKTLRRRAADIRKHGQAVPIERGADGKILDGRNRWVACRIAGVEPRENIYNGANAMARIWSLNGERRRESKGAWQIAAGRWEIWLQTEGRSSSGTNSYQGRSRETVAKKFGIGQQTVQSAGDVIRKGIPELAAAVERGELSLGAAAVIARKLPKDQHQAALGAEEARKRQADRQDRQTAKQVAALKKKYPKASVLNAARIESGVIKEGLEKLAELHKTLSTELRAAKFLRWPDLVPLASIGNVVMKVIKKLESR